MFLCLLKLLVTGAVAAMPPGPVAVIVMQKTLSHGRKGGLAAGVGSGLIDTTYGAIAMMTVGAIMSFIEKNSSLIMLFGGIIVAVVGFFLARPGNGSTVSNRDPYAGDSAGLASFPLQTALCALANPGAIGAMLALVAFFKLSPADSGIPFPLMLLTLWCGEMLWWTLFTAVTYKARERISDSTVPKICRIAGIAVIAFGLVISVRGLITLI